MGKTDWSEAHAKAELELLTDIAMHTSDTARRLMPYGVTNGVLEVSTRLIPSEGWIQLTWQTTCGAIEVHNPGTNVVTVVGTLGAGTRPMAGIGVSHVQAGQWRAVNVNSRAVTIYGTAGDYVGIQAFTAGGIQ